MTKDQATRMEALLMQNCYLQYCNGQQPFSEPEVWVAVAKNHKSLKEWLDNGNELSEGNYPGSIMWPEDPH